MNLSLGPQILFDNLVNILAMFCNEHIRLFLNFVELVTRKAFRFSFDPIQNKTGNYHYICNVSLMYTMCKALFLLSKSELDHIYTHIGGYRTIVIVEVFEHFVFYF
jgi:hypothetical protein